MSHEICNNDTIYVVEIPTKITLITDISQISQLTQELDTLGLVSIRLFVRLDDP